MKPATYLGQLGAALDEAWRQGGRDEERFDQVAAAALAEHPPLEHLGREALFDELLDPTRSAVRQLRDLGAWGQPGQTVFHGEGFAVEIDVWLEQPPGIYDHPFHGAVVLLDGWGVHASYRVAEHPRGPGCAWGRVHFVDTDLETLDLLLPGRVLAVSPGDGRRVDAVVPVGVPTVAMTVRTVRAREHRRLLPPGLSLPLGPQPEPLARRLALLESLGNAGEPSYPERLARELVHADLETAVLLLAGGWSAWDDEEAAELLATLRLRHGEAIDALGPALDRADRAAEATDLRGHVADPGLRLALTALAYAETREQVLELLGSFSREGGLAHPAARPGRRAKARAESPLELLHRLVDEVETYDEDDEVARVLAHALVDGEDADGVLARLVEEFGADQVEPHAPALRRICELSLFAVLGGGR